MKVNLLLNAPGDVRSGYANIDPFHEGDNLVKGDVANLNWLCDDGECEEVVAHDLLDYYPRCGIEEIVTGWAKKLKRGGKLAISCVDLREVARGLLTGQLTSEQARTLLCGPQRQVWEFKKCPLTGQEVRDILKGIGLEVLTERYDGYRFVLVCGRPGGETPRAEHPLP